jgi:hypothetical protein
MTDLNFLLCRMNQRMNASQANRLEDAATATLVGVVALVALAVLL